MAGLPNDLAASTRSFAVTRHRQRPLAKLPIPKRMRWGDSDSEFVRPVRWLLMLMGGEVVEAEIWESALNLTHGHRFHAPDPLVTNSSNEYVDALRERGHVVANFAERQCSFADSG